MANDDLSWTQLSEPWERVAWARARKFESKEAAATALGMKAGTYRAYERPSDSSKTTVLKYNRAVEFGRKFGVRWQWLLDRDGTPWPDETPADRAKRMIDAEPADRQEELVKALEVLLRRQA